MKVLVAGATGVLGRRLVRLLRERGHDVVGLARSEANERTIRSDRGEPQRADLFDVDSLVRAGNGSDVVIHAATKIPTKVRIRRRDWMENDGVRLQGTKALLEATARIGAHQYVQQSIVWLAQPPGGAPFDEDSAFRNPHPAFQSMIDAESYVGQASVRHGFAASILRCGMFYSADSAQTRRMGETLLRRRLPIMGSGAALWRLIHTDDAAHAFAAATESGKEGVWHVVGDEPVAVENLLAAMAQRVGAPAPRHVPLWLARLFAGRDVVSIFTQSTRTSADRLRRDFGWTPRFPTWQDGLDEIVAALRAEGLIPPSSVGRAGT